MGYGIAQIWECRKEAGKLRPAVRVQDVEAYEALRDGVISSFLPRASNTTKNTELRWYRTALQENNGALETSLYGEIWDDLLPNERLAIEHLYYEDASLVDEASHSYQAIHDYIVAKRSEDKALARRHLAAALWEILHNAPYPARNVLERDKARHRRKAQAAMLNSLNLALHTLQTPDYIVDAIRQRYAAAPLEELLPNIVLPLEYNARKIAEEIQHINAEVQQEIRGLIAEAQGQEPPSSPQQKSVVTEAATSEEATEAFVMLVTNIVEGVRSEIEVEIDTQAAEGATPDEMDIRLKEILSRYEDTTIPQKMDMLATHFNGKLTELEQRKAGYDYYIWRTQDDEKVRHNHARYDDLIFRWDHPSPSGHPGEDYNCRCWPEPIIRDDITGYHRFYYVEDHPIQGIEGFYPELILIPAARGAKIVGEGLKRIIIAAGKIRKNPIVRGEKAPKGGRKDTKWEFGAFKSKTKWQNQKEKRGWTDDEITNTIKDGDRFPAPNKVNPNNAASRYQTKDGRFVVRDDDTKEILQVSDKRFEPNIIE